MVNIFEYVDYRSYLRDLFIEKKKQGKAFSHRILAQRLGLSTSNYVMLIMQGKRNLNPDLRYKMSEVFRHSAKETEYFENMVYFSHAKTDAEKNCYLSRMLALRKTANVEVLHDSQYEYLSKWYNPIIRELVTHPEWNGDFTALGKMVRPPISAFQARKSVDLLIRCGLIATVDGTYKQSSPLIATEKVIVSVAITEFHREMAKRALEILDSPDKQNRNMTGCTLHISRKTFDLMKEELTQFRTRILSLAEMDEGADSVYHLNLQLFPVSSALKQRKKNG